MNSKTKKITTIGMLCAITYVIMAVGRIPVVLFLKYDPSDVIVTLPLREFYCYAFMNWGCWVQK